MTLKALMADVDGVVLVDDHPWGWSATLEADLGLSPKALQAAFFDPHWRDVVHGRARLAERLAPVLDRIAPGLATQTLVDYWFSRSGRLNEALIDQIAALRARGVAAHLATVQEHERAGYIWDVLGLRDHFDAIHYAAELGAAKPEPAFFAAIEARTGLAPAEVFFIDDRPENIAAARAAGWPAELWTGESSLQALMDQAGVGAP